MNSKLTVRNLVKYWGCKVKCDNCHFPELEYWFTYITAQYITLYAATKPAGIIREIGFSQIKISDCQLLLTPLSAITDEHAIEVAKVIRPEWPIELCADGMWKESFVEMVLSDIAKLHPSRAKAMWDYLRSLCYDCDNAISEGWGVDRLAFVK